MDTKPIFDFLNELEFRSHYQAPPKDAERLVLAKNKADYLELLREMRRQFEACLLQCMLEDAGFDVGLVMRKLNVCVHDLEDYLETAPFPFGIDKEVALRVGRESLRSLVMGGVIEPKSESTKTTVDGITVDVSKIDWSKPVYTADEVKKLLGVSDTTFRRWMNAGWITYSQMDGSDKRFIQREHLMEFLNNPKVLYPSTK